MSSENLKFRVWDKKLKKYRDDDVVAGNFFISTEGDLFVWNDHDLIRAEPERFVVEQSTGLYDVNGKLIYQGDIIERCEANFNVVKYFCRMVFLDPRLACFYEMLPGANVRYSLDYTTAAKCEVVGNINENVDFLGLESRYGKGEAKKVLAEMRERQWM